jgi:Subtilase family
MIAQGHQRASGTCPIRPAMVFWRLIAVSTCTMVGIVTLTPTAFGQPSSDNSIKYASLPEITQIKATAPVQPTSDPKPEELVYPSLGDPTPADNDPVRAEEARKSWNVNGGGLAVAVLDTGLNVKHLDFAPESRILVKVNYTTDDEGVVNKVKDYHGHGSNVSGIILANGIHTGIAPGANIVPLKIVERNAPAKHAAIVKALQWVIDNHDKYQIPISVVVASFGDTGNHITDTYPVAQQLRGDAKAMKELRGLVTRLRDAKIPVVAAAGNYYWRFNQNKDAKDDEVHQGMVSPAIIRETISVGAVYDGNYGSKSYPKAFGQPMASLTGKDLFAPYSQRLHESVGHLCRTDVFAPGGPTRSSGNDESDPRCESQDYMGTSQSVPVVAGTILLLQQYHMRKTGKLPCVDHLEAWLRAGGKWIRDGSKENDNVPHTGACFPRVDVMEALTLIDEGPCTHN